MKNKFVFFITVCLFININYYNIKAEEFVFESSFIEITNDGNIIQAKDGVLITNWFMPAYGKTPDSFMADKEKAIEQATVIALRDAGAKLMLDFYRIPAINDWLSRQNINQESQSL